MAAAADISTEFYWDIIVFKVEDVLFRVPRCEFEDSSEIFADMFLLPSAVDSTEGRDKEHPIVLEGYKKDEFSSLLRVMYPRTKSIISGTKYQLSLKKEEWVSVLKLSTIWNMNHIREYAIHRLSIDGALTSIEKIQLARAHRVAKWMEEGLVDLVIGSNKLTRADLAKLGWKTSALILWIRETSTPSLSSPFYFSQDMIQCGKCSYNLNDEFFSECCTCEQPLGTNCLNVSVSFLFPGTIDPVVKLDNICCSACDNRCYAGGIISCPSCLLNLSTGNVRISLKKSLDEKIGEIFGEDIKDLI